MIDISVCIITLGRETLYKTLETVFSQRIDSSFEVVLILQGIIDIKRINDINKNSIPCHIFISGHGLGFGFYRNQALKYAKGNILAWIDDDEWTMNDCWLSKLTYNIRKGKYDVVTSGYYIPLGQGYMTDCISLMGWPGGGALGFDKMWQISYNNETNHICTGNFAIKKSLMRQIGFFNDAKYGGEDNFISKNISIRKIIIFYEKHATVYHVSRSFLQALPWWQLRVKSHQEAARKSMYEENGLKKKFRFLKNVFRLDYFFPGKVVCLFCIGFIFVYFSLRLYMRRY